MTAQPQATKEVPRKRRPHKKSRRGCRNCKLRSVKCDETRPKCQKCTSYGVVCNYDTRTPDLQMCFDGAVTIADTKSAPGPGSTNQSTLSRVEIPPYLYYPAVIADNDSVFELDRQSVDRLSRFQTKTMYSIGPKRSVNLFQTTTISLACSHPFLMHVVQALTAAHDRYLSAPGNNPRQTVAEVYHLSRAAALFNKKLSAPIQPNERDALWATAALIGTITFCWIEATTPEEAWPLRPAEPSDLEWLRMAESKTTIWNLTDPLRPDSAFHALKDDYGRDYFAAASAVPPAGVAGLPPTLARLCGLGPASNPRSSPYFAALHVLAPLLLLLPPPSPPRGADSDSDRAALVRYLGFVAHLRPAFRRLLERKEPRALLLLAFWYAKVCRAVWWLEWRAVMECRATCLYLERYHGHEVEIMQLLRWPKMRCGLLEAEAGCLLWESLGVEEGESGEWSLV